jgi:F0F1-type ATP synthase membrane subunit a
MQTSTESEKGHGEAEEMQEIAKLARSYAEGRRIGPFLVFWVVFILLCAAIGLPSHFAGGAYRGGNMVGFWLCIAALVPALGAAIWFAVRGDRWMERTAERLYGREGRATVAVPKTRRNKKWFTVALVLFLGCIVASVILGGRGYIPTEYMQPASAVYTVPFLVFLVAWHRREIGLGMLLWPGLYAAHAILLVAGAPIRFSGEWESLNMLIPIAGYGLLLGLIGYVVNRLTLRKLKKLTRLEPAGGPAEAEGN